MRPKTLIPVWGLLLAATVFAQQPKLQNAKPETIEANAGLQPAMDSLLQKQPGPAWIGYSMPVVARERTMCCFDSVDQFRSFGGCCAGCRLENDHSNFVSGNVNSDCGPLEPPKIAFILLRIEDHKL